MLIVAAAKRIRPKNTENLNLGQYQVDLNTDHS